MPAAEEFQKLIAPLFPGLMGITIKEASKERIVASMLVRPDLCTAGGVCHGGAYMALADTLGAIGTVVNLPPNTRTTTIESKTNFLGAAAVNSEVMAESVPLHRGRTTQVWQTTIRSQAGKLCAIVMQTQMVLPT
jgi:1,4-dihydroxy-2-naphthoyl-CoA hydrolase